MSSLSPPPSKRPRRAALSTDSPSPPLFQERATETTATEAAAEEATPEATSGETGGHELWGHLGDLVRVGEDERPWYIEYVDAVHVSLWRPGEGWATDWIRKDGAWHQVDGPNEQTGLTQPLRLVPNQRGRPRGLWTGFREGDHVELQSRNAFVDPDFRVDEATEALVVQVDREQDAAFLRFLPEDPDDVEQNLSRRFAADTHWAQDVRLVGRSHPNDPSRFWSKRPDNLSRFSDDPDLSVFGNEAEEEKEETPSSSPEEVRTVILARVDLPPDVVWEFVPVGEQRHTVELQTVDLLDGLWGHAYETPTTPIQGGPAALWRE